MPGDPWRMHRVTLRFASAQAESAFAMEQAEKARRPTRIAVAGLALLVVAFYVFTNHVFPGVVVGIGAAQALRYTVGALGIGLFAFALSFRPVFVRHHQALAVACACALWLGVVGATARAPLPVLEARGFTMPLIFTFLVYGLFRLRIVGAVVSSGFGTLLYLGAMSTLGPASATGAGRGALLLVGANVAGMLVCWQIEVAARREFAAMRQLDAERSRAESLLLNILPASIAQQLKASGEAIAEYAGGVTVLFADIVGFTVLAATRSPQQVVDLLNRVFTAFDALADAHGLEKIKTIGDAYMAAAGLPQACADHAQRAARMALAMHRALADIASETGAPLDLRVGLHSGPVVAGVIGRRKFAYDLWGDTVNTASRMESHGVAGGVHCSAATAALLGEGFALEARGPIEVKGKGRMETFLVRGELGQAGA